MILVVGCGFLGTYILKHISSRSEELIVATVQNLDNVIPIKKVKYIQCDVTQKNDINALFEMCNCSSLKIIYLAACHNIDYVYENPSDARKVNIDGLENFISLMPKTSKLFFASTDCVYGEGKNRYEKFKESDKLDPINEYGKQKAEAENLILDYGHKVFRLPFMIGPSLNGKPHFYDNIISKLSLGDNIEMIDGLSRSVLSYRQAAEIIYELTFLPYDKLPKIINLCGDKALNKYEIGCAITVKAGLSTENIIKIAEKDGEKFFKDKRASCTAMDNTLLKKLLGLDEIKWEV